MNEKAVEKLVAAAMRGQRQIVGSYSDDRGGLCALGVLGFGEDVQTLFELARAYGISCGDGGEDRQCPECTLVRRDEWSLIEHLNDDHRADFLTIARKLGPDAA